MRHIIVLFAMIASILLLSRCSPKTNSSMSKAPAANTASTSEATVAEIKKSYTEDQLAAGDHIRQSNCNRCHKLYAPEDFTVAQWERILPGMFSRARLGQDDAAKVRGYILVHARM